MRTNQRVLVVVHNAAITRKFKEGGNEDMSNFSGGDTIGCGGAFPCG